MEDAYNELLDKTNLILSLVQDIKEYQEGNWEIKNNQMIFYDKDNNVLAKYNLYDNNGNLNASRVFKRVKVE